MNLNKRALAASCIAGSGGSFIFKSFLRKRCDSHGVITNGSGLMHAALGASDGQIEKPCKIENNAAPAGAGKEDNSFLRMKQ